MLWAALIVVYLLGAIPFGYLIHFRLTGRDIREEGSGNIGATNVARVAGKFAGAVTLLLDAGKGYLGVTLMSLAARGQGGAREWMGAAAVAVLLGHMFPVFLRFRGGKGVAAGLGAFAALAPWAVVQVLVIFGVVLAVWRYVSLGSIVATALFPVAQWFFYHPPLGETAGSIVAALLIIGKHSANIQRLLRDTEPHFHL
jgi:glycerol-3-phosphate acyltransferase PlsY